MQGRTPNAGPYGQCNDRTAQCRAVRPMQGVRPMHTLNAAHGPAMQGRAQCRAVRSMQGRLLNECRAVLNAGPFAQWCRAVCSMMQGRLLDAGPYAQ